MAENENNGLNLKTRADLEKYLQDLSSKLEETQASLAEMSKSKTEEETTEDNNNSEETTEDTNNSEEVTDEEVDELQALLDLD